MKYCLVADDGESQVVVAESDNERWLSADACDMSDEGTRIKSACKWHVCRREPSANGTQRVVIETWEKGVKL